MSVARVLVFLVLIGLGGFALFQGKPWMEGGSTDDGLHRTGSGASLDPTPGAERIALDVRAPEGVDPRAQGGHARAIELARRNGEGVAALDRDRVDEAIALFESCVLEGPQEPIFKRNLAEALARRAAAGESAGDLELREHALEDLVRAIELDPTRDDLEAFLERWRRSVHAEQDFWRKQTEHFELSFDGTRSELMWGTAPLENELESAYHEFGELFGVFPVEEGRSRFRVVLYRPETFGSVTGLDDWAAGAFDGTVRVPVQDLGEETERLKSILRHELMHAFVHEVGGAHVPGWLNEGLAQLQEPPFRNDRLPLRSKAEGMLRGADLFTLAQLEGSLASWTDRAAIEVAYAQSLAFVAYVERFYSEGVLIDMVAGCKLGRTPAATFEAGLGIELEVVLADMARGL